MTERRHTARAAEMPPHRRVLMFLAAILPRASFGRHVAVLAGGTALAQGAALAVSPLITRLYRPSDFGALAAYTAVTSIVTVISSLRYDLAIPIPEDDGVAANLLALCCAVVLAITAVLGVLVFVSGDWLPRTGRLELVVHYAWLLPFSVLGGGMYQAFNYWALRRRAFARVARTRVTQTLTILGSQIVLGVLGVRPAGLLGADAFGRGVGTGTLAFAVSREDRVALRSISWRGILNAAREYRRFPQYGSGAAILNAVGLNLAPLLIAGHYGAQAAGEFALSQRLLGVPMTLIGDAVSQVFLVEASRIAREDRRAFNALLNRTIMRLIAMGVVPMGLVFLAGPWLFRVVFGAAWYDAGDYARILSGMVLLQFAVTPVSQTMNVLKLLHWQLLWDAGRLALVGGTFLFVAHHGLSARASVVGYAISMAFAYAVYFVILKLAARPLREAK